MRIRWRGLELPSRVVLDETVDGTYGKFVIEPFEYGFGSTVGNSLRRILLSSLEGSAVSRIKIQGVQHEFTSLPGVVEDVTEICLNVKSLIVRSRAVGPRVLRISKNERGVVAARDILPDDLVDVVNPDLVIATVTDDVPFHVEMHVESGRGYSPAADRLSSDQEVGLIPLDAVFSPILRVRYRVDETRVGQRTNFDKLVLEIWTDGTIGPESALVESAKILRKHLTPFIYYRESGAVVSPDGGLRNMVDSTGYSPVDLELEQKLGQSLAELNLSVRATNCLESEGINSVRDLVSRTEDQLLQVRNFGETTLVEVAERLAGLGLRLGMRLPQTSSNR